MLICQMSKRWSAVIYFLSVSLLSACSSDYSDEETQTKPTTQYSFDLTSNQVPVIPAVSSDASGTATLSLDNESGALSGSITLSNNISATAAHIHKGVVGTTGGVIITLTQDATNSQQYHIPANTVLLATQIDELVSGEYYVNVHTATYPAGELRGQILEASQSALVTELTTSQLPSLSQITSTGVARGFLAIDNTTGDLSGSVRMSAITPTAMHIHLGYLGNTGGPVVTLSQSSDPAVWDIPSSTMLTDSQVTDLNSGKLYFNLHTAANPGGELHGQITSENIQLYIVDLVANTGVTSTAEGKAFITLNNETGLLNSTVRTSGIAITNMHIHDNDNSGAVVKGFIATTDAAMWEISDATLSALEVESLNDGAYYVNVHSSTYPAGELSGIIE